MGGTEYNHSLLIDFGFESNAIFKTCLSKWPYAPAPNVFLLSHFHTDHYNGFRFLFPLAHCFDFKNIYLPCMPVMQHMEHVKLGLAFLSLAIRAQSIPIDVIEMIINASKTHPMFHIVGQGDSFYHNNAKYDVLWPPKAICDDEVLADVRRTIDSCEKKKEGDNTLKKIYHNLMDSGITMLLDGREQLRDEQKQEIFQRVANGR